MHLLSVIHFPQYGGPHSGNANLVPLFLRAGIGTTVILPSAEGNAAPLLRQRGVDTIQMPLSRLRAVRDPRAHLRFLLDFRAEVKSLRGVMRDLRADVVMLNGLVNPHAAVAANIEGIPVVWQLLDTFAPMAFRRLMMPMVVRSADVIMTTGTRVAAEHPGASKLGDRLIHYFPAVDTDLFVKSDTTKARARAELGIADDSLVIGNIANLNPMKGHDVFLRAAAGLRRERPGTKFLLLGAESPAHGAYTASLWRAAHELGLALGRDLFVTDPGTDVARYAAALDVFWLTSNARSEGIPTVIGEAMSLELPVVASQVGSVEEAVAAGITGELVPPRDPVALVRASLPYVDDLLLRQRVGKAARSRAQRLYSIEACAKQHVLAFELAIRHRS